MDVIYILDLAGTCAFAISGTLSAMNKRFDLFGAFFIGMVTAIGGGTTRDCVLGATPVAWLTDENYFYIIVVGVIATLIFKNFVSRLKRTLFLFDSIGIGIFTVIGVEKALGMGVPATTAVLMGISSSVIGGVIRDVLCNDIPLIFHKEIYATACMVGALVFILLQQLGLDAEINTAVTASAIIFIRVLSVKYNWSLPNSNIYPEH